MRQKTVTVKLLQSVTEVYYKVHQVLQSVTEGYYKVRQVLESVTDCYYKVRQVLQSATVVTKRWVTTWYFRLVQIQRFLAFLSLIFNWYLHCSNKKISEICTLFQPVKLQIFCILTIIHKIAHIHSIKRTNLGLRKYEFFK